MSVKVKQVQDKIRKEVAKELAEGLPITYSVPLSEENKWSMIETGLGVFGSGKCGKTTTFYHMIRQLIQDPKIQIKIWDPAQNWKHNFDSIYYQDIDPSYLDRMQDVYFDSGHIIFNAKFIDPKEAREMLSAMVALDYEYQWRCKDVGVMTNYIHYVVEEAPTVLSVMGRNSPWNSFINIGRNMNLSFSWLGRRMADLSASARQNVREYLWGNMMGELDVRRVKDCSNKEISEMLPGLERGEFIYWNGQTATRFINKEATFIQNGKPKEWKPK